MVNRSDVMYFATSGLTALAAGASTESFMRGEDLTGLIGCYVTLAVSSLTVKMFRLIRRDRVRQEFSSEFPKINSELDELKREYDEHPNEESAEKYLSACTRGFRRLNQLMKYC